MFLTKNWVRVLLVGLVFGCASLYGMEPSGLTREEAQEQRRFWLQVPGRHRVYFDMVGDLFRAGHVNAIRNAVKKACEVFSCEPGEIYMIIGVNGDADCASYKRLPILNVDERCAAIAACRFVNEVIKNSPLVLTASFLDENHIDLVVHGDDFDPAKLRTIPRVFQPVILFAEFWKGLRSFLRN